MSLFKIKRGKPFKCCECNFCGENEKFYNILGDTYCKEHAKEWIEGEILEHFDNYMDDLAELVGVQVLGGFE